MYSNAAIRRPGASPRPAGIAAVTEIDALAASLTSRSAGGRVLSRRPRITPQILPARPESLPAYAFARYPATRGADVKPHRWPGQSLR